MPVALTYPGVYIQELPSAVRPIVGVATSVAAFVGLAPRGRTDFPVQVNSWADYEQDVRRPRPRLSTQLGRLPVLPQRRRDRARGSQRRSGSADRLRGAVERHHPERELAGAVGRRADGDRRHRKAPRAQGQQVQPHHHRKRRGVGVLSRSEPHRGGPALPADRPCGVTAGRARPGQQVPEGAGGQGLPVRRSRPAGRRRPGRRRRGADPARRPGRQDRHLRAGQGGHLQHAVPAGRPRGDPGPGDHPGAGGRVLRRAPRDAHRRSAAGMVRRHPARLPDRHQ